MAAARRIPRRTLLGALAALYMAQGVPYGFATEYLPVALREAGFSLTAISAVAWLQLPWQLKVLWAPSADRPWARRRARAILLGFQLLLALVLCGFAIAPIAQAPVLWFALTAGAAFVASAQDVFVDATAVRTLGPGQRGWGNTAQVAGYRMGMLLGGAWLLLLIGRVGNRTAVLACGALVALTAFAARALRDASGPTPPSAPERGSPRAVLGALFGRESWPVLGIALGYKLGAHVAAIPLKAMPVDAGWSKHTIGLVVVIAGTTFGLLGSVAGGAMHSRTKEGRALAVGCVLQSAACIPLIVALKLGVGVPVTSVAIAFEHFISALGTTVLFAALMSATRPADAGLHYTVLTGANALVLGLGGTLGAVIAEHAGKMGAFVAAAALGLAPLPLVARWNRASDASAGRPRGPDPHG